jgi:hypothetical protein
VPEQETPSTETEQTVETPPEGNTPEGEQTAEKPGEKPSEEVSAEVLRKELTDVRAEAANYRVKLREAEAKFANAKTPEEFEAAVNELKAQNESLERQILLTNVARKYELPDALAKRLTGKTEAELEADAKELQKLVAPAPPQTLGGGLNPDEGTEDFDLVKASRAARKRSY